MAILSPGNPTHGVLPYSMISRVLFDNQDDTINNILMVDYDTAGVSFD